MSKTVLVTGAAGFIGSHLCEFLVEKGLTVHGIDNFDPFYARAIKEDNLSHLTRSGNFTFWEGDAGDELFLSRLNIQPVALIHLAAKAGVQPSLKNPLGYLDANIKQTNVLLDWMCKTGVKKMLFASSSSVYGNTDEVPFHENQNVDQPVSPYAFTKRACELLNYTYHHLYGLDIINLRFFTVYGERQRPDLAIHKFVKKMLNGQPIQLYGDGTTSRDYTYYKDTVKGIYNALLYINENEKVYDTFNLGNHIPVRLVDLVRAISDAVGQPANIQYESKKPGDVDITFADITHAQKTIGYDPTTNLQEGLQNFVAWYREKQKTGTLKGLY